MSTRSDPVLLLTGDVMTGRGIDQVLAHRNSPQLFESWIRDARDYVGLAERVSGPIPAPVPADYPWGDALAAIERAAPDLRLINLETAVTTCDDAWPAKGIHYRMHPGNVDVLRAARIDACALANNHVLDWGRRGLAETLQTLWQAGIVAAGAGADDEAAWAPAVLPLRGGGRVLLFACATPSSGVPAAWAAGPRRPGVALLPDLSAGSARRVAEQVARHRRAGDRVVLSIHWGGNWGLEVPREHREFARRLIELDAADLVHGHSSHHPLPPEIVEGRLVLYGCGDLINDYEGIGPHGELRSDVGCLYFATLAAGSGRLRRLDIVPLQLERFALKAADAAARAWLEEVFASDARRRGPRPTPQPWGWSLTGGDLHGR